MAFSWDNKNAPTKFSWQTQGLGATKEQKIAIEKQDLVAKGVPVSRKADRLEPTMGGTILRDAIKPVARLATNLINAEQIVRGKKETQPFSGGYLGKIDAVGQKGTFVDKVKDSIGTGAELASWLVGGGSAGGVAKTALRATAKTAAKQTIKEFAIKQLPKLAIEGAGATGLYSTGTQLEKNAKDGTKFDFNKLTKDMLLGAALNPVVGIALHGALGTNTGKIMAARQAERIAKDAEVLGRPIPEVGNPSAKFMQESNRMIESPKIQLPEPGILKGQQTVRDFNTPKTPEVPVKIAKTKTVKTPVIDSAPAQGIPKEAIPEFKAKVDYGTTVLDNVNPESANKGNHKLYSETVYGDIAKDPERVRRIAMGSGEQTTNGVPADAYYAIAKNEAAKSGNIKLIKELADSNVGTISGKKLEANKLTQEGDIVDTVRDIYKARAKAVGVSEEALKRNEKSMVENLKTQVKVMLDKIPTKQEMNDIINSLVCK